MLLGRGEVGKGLGAGHSRMWRSRVWHGVGCERAGRSERRISTAGPAVAWKTSRLESRNYEAYMPRCPEILVQLPSIVQLPDRTRGATGRLMLNMFAAMAQFEREMMLERQREGIAKAKAEGKYKGRKPTARAKADDAVFADAIKNISEHGVYRPSQIRDSSYARLRLISQLRHVRQQQHPFATFIDSSSQTQSTMASSNVDTVRYFQLRERSRIEQASGLFHSDLDYASLASAELAVAHKVSLACPPVSPAHVFQEPAARTILA